MTLERTWLPPFSNFSRCRVMQNGHGLLPVRRDCKFEKVGAFWGPVPVLLDGPGTSREQVWLSPESAKRPQPAGPTSNDDPLGTIYRPACGSHPRCDLVDEASLSSGLFLVVFSESRWRPSCSP